MMSDDLKDKGLPGASLAIFHRRKDDGETEFGVNPSKKGALASAGAGAAAGSFFGPVGTAVGAGIGG